MLPNVRSGFASASSSHRFCARIVTRTFEMCAFPRPESGVSAHDLPFPPRAPAQRRGRTQDLFLTVSAFGELMFKEFDLCSR